MKMGQFTILMHYRHIYDQVMKLRAAGTKVGTASLVLRASRIVGEIVSLTGFAVFVTAIPKSVALNKGRLQCI
jgi:hypothetical protein